MAASKTRKRIRKPRVRVRKRKTKSQILSEAKTQISSPQGNHNSSFWIIAPSGKCPVLLEGNSPEEIDEWVNKVKKTGKHTVQSISYWVGDFYQSFSPEAKEIRKYIELNHKKYDLRNSPTKLLVQNNGKK